VSCAQTLTSPKLKKINTIRTKVATATKIPPPSSFVKLTKDLFKGPSTKLTTLTGQGVLDAREEINSMKKKKGEN
jgi:hypothetical protein